MLSACATSPPRSAPGRRGSNFTHEAAFGLDFLHRMWDDRTRTLYYQVGVGRRTHRTVGDHDIWRLPQADDRYGGTEPALPLHPPPPRLARRAARLAISPNLAGRLAAAFALCYQVFRRSTALRSRADACSPREHVFDLADTAPNGSTSSPLHARLLSGEPSGATISSSARSSSTTRSRWPGAASGLPHADPGSTCRLAAHWAHAYITRAARRRRHAQPVRRQPGSPTTTCTAPSPGTDSAASRRPARLCSPTSKRQLAGAIRQAHRDPFGFGFAWAQCDTTTHGAGPSVTASEVRPAHRGAATTRRWSSAGSATSSARMRGDCRSSSGPAPRSRTACSTRSRTSSARSTAPPDPAGAVVEGPNARATTGVVDGMRKSRHGWRPVPAVRREGRLRRRRPVVPDRRARDRPRRVATTRPRTAGGGAVLGD